MSLIVSRLVAALHRPARWGSRVLRWALLALALIWLLLLSLWLLLHWAILPNLDRWRPELEAQASKALGVSVKVDALQVATGGWMPVIDLRGVRLIDAQGREALQLPRVSAALSARSLLAWPPRFEQLYIHQPELELRRDRQGLLWVAGLPLRASSSREPDAFSDWLLRQYEVAIAGGRLRWIDELQADASPVQLEDLQLLLRNGLRRHEIRIDATPPAELGQRFSLRGRVTQPLLSRPADWRRWSGLFYADLPQAELPALRQRLALPFELRRGRGALRLWTELERGRVREVTTDLQLADVRLRLSPRVEPLELASLGVRLAWQRLSDGTRWSVRGLQFSLPASGDQQASDWAASNLTLSLNHELAQPQLPWQVPELLRGGQLQADRLDLALLARLAAGLPLGSVLHEQLRLREPLGQLRSVEARWQGPLDAPQTWSLAGQADALQLLALPAPEATAESPAPLGQPGFAGAALRFAASERGGEARLQLRDGALLWPGLLELERLAVRELELELRWQRQEQGWRVQAPRLLLDSPQLRLTGDAAWRSNGRPGGLLELQLRAPQAAVTAVPDHLPRSLPLAVRQYLRDSLQAGELRDLRLELKGALADFPFRALGSGLFRVSAQVSGGRYAYLPSHEADAGRAAYQSAWPVLEGLKGELRFEGPLLRLRGFSGLHGGLTISEVDARIEDLGRDAQLRVNGRWRGELAQGLAFVRQTPINGWTEQALAQAQGSGPVSGQLQLALPLQRPEQAQLRGQVQLGSPLAATQLRLRPDLPAFAQLRGAIDYSERSLQLKGLQARFLGGELRLSGGTRADGGRLQIEAEGQATAEGLRAAGREWPALAGLAPHLSGQADYQLRLAFDGATPELELRSSLVGMESKLPEPMRKGAEQSWPLLLRVQPQAQGREAWGLSLGSSLRALLQREAGRTLRGAIRVGSDGPVPLPEQGVQLVWAAPQIDLDPWRRLASRGGAAVGESGAAGSAWLPEQMLLQTPLLRVAGRTLQEVSLNVQRAANRRDWKLSLQSQQALGEAEYRLPPGKPPQLQARLSKLALSQGEAQALEPGPDGLSPAQDELPMLDLQVESFELRGRQLGKLVIQADGAAAGEDWTLEQLSLHHPDARLQANGRWRASDRRTQLDWQLDIDNSGRWLDALGFTNTVRGGKGKLRGVLGWRGSPLDPSTRGLEGEFNVQLESGQFLKADPGVARLLGILSLQSLPRRLLFDWRDVFSGGFAFDEFAGDVRITQGVASTQNLRMRGLQANVLMDGSADLSAETTELKVLVVPNLDAGGATLAYTAINPAIGLTTFLAQLLLRKPIEAANTTQLRISGPWADPKVDKVERSGAQPATPRSNP